MYQPELGLVPLSPNDNVLDVPLFLPSSLSRDTQSQCHPKLVVMEKDLRLGQCYDTLNSLHIHLHSKSRLLKDKHVNVRHQGPNTKSRDLINTVSSRISATADRYSTSYPALCELDTDPTAKWQTELHTLHANDIRGVSEPSLPDHPDPDRASAILARKLLSGGAYPAPSVRGITCHRGFGEVLPRAMTRLVGIMKVCLVHCDHLESTSDYFQCINSSGRNRMPEASVGKRRSSSSRKKCNGPLSSSSGSLRVGWPRLR